LSEPDASDSKLTYFLIATAPADYDSFLALSLASSTSTCGAQTFSMWVFSLSSSFYSSTVLTGPLKFFFNSNFSLSSAALSSFAV
jgi:hypothetical protein